MMVMCPSFYANCPDIIVNSISFHSQKCSSLDHKLYGHLQAGKVSDVHLSHSSYLMEV